MEENFEVKKKSGVRKKRLRGCLRKKMDFENQSVGRYVVKHGQKKNAITEKIKIAIAVFFKKMFGSWVTLLVGRHVVKELKDF